MHPKRFLSLWYVWRKLCTYLAPILTPCPNGSKRDSTRPTHLGVASGACKTISKPMVRLAQTVHLSASAISPNGPNKLPLEPRHIGVPSGAVKMIFGPMVCLAQTVHISCTNTNNISKWTEMRFHLSLITYEYHRVRPKRFLSLWYVWHKPCTYLALIITLYPNRPK